MSKAGHAHLMCNGHQNMTESSKILGVPHGGTTPRHVDIVPLPLLLPNIGVASIWSAWIKHPIVIAMKRNIEHSVRGGTGGGGGGGWSTLAINRGCTRHRNDKILTTLIA